MDTKQAVAHLLSLAESDYDAFKTAVAAVLGGIDPTRPFGTELFNAHARIGTSIPIEAFAFRRLDDGLLEIFLRRRSEDDTAYPGEWHAPGTILRPREDIEVAMGRLAGEFGSKILSFVFIKNFNTTDEARGHMFSVLHLVEIMGECRSDETHGWFSVDALPRPFVDIHEPMLVAAIGAFEKRESGQ